MESICCSNIGDEGDADDIVNNTTSSINVDNIERDGIGTVSSIVRAFDTDVSHQSRTNDLDLTKIAEALILLN